MKKPKLSLRVLSALLALVLLASLCPAALAAERTVSVGSLDGLQALARRCASDEYSRGLTVTLTADVDAGGEALSIPIFLGTFDGQGHCITGLRLTQSASDIGLFSRVETGAVIRDLAVSGEVTPDGTQSGVGGIAGRNDGSIVDCSFSGIVVGSDSVGGITGHSGEGGVIARCTVSGVVRGTQYTGGVVGRNDGTVLRCSNEAAVNTTFSDSDLSSEPAELEDAFYSLLKQEKTAEHDVTSDTGGIAGLSTGVLQSCTNTGKVGYPHVGYNVGGIAGRQNGYMDGCVNQGSVQGRKDVGGVVGQMAPDITLQASDSDLDALRDDLNALQTLIDRTLDDAQATSDQVSGHISRLSDYAGSAGDSAHALTTRLSDFTDENISALDDTILLAERYIDKAVPVMDDLAAAADEMTDAVSSMQELLDALDDLTGSTAQTHFRRFCEEMNAACDALTNAADALERAWALITGGVALPDAGPLREDISTLREQVAALEKTLAQAAEELNASGTLTPETAAQLRGGLQAVLRSEAAAVRDLAEWIIGLDLSALRGLDLETLRQAAGCLRDAMKDFVTAAGHLGKALGELGAALRAVDPGALGEAADRLNDTLDAAAGAADSLTDALSGAARWADALSKEEPIRFTTLGAQFRDDADALNTSLNGINGELSALNTTLSGANTTLLADVRAINNQFMKVMNRFFDLIDEVGSGDYTDVFEDVSEQSLHSAVRGKVMECSNYGEVSADRNAGGIAGAMAIEYDLDPEDDLLSSENRTLRSTYQTRAILLDCGNYAAVTVKKSCAGSVAGRMDLGTVFGCGGWGGVTSESGSYVGGVAGLSLSSIRESYAKCALSGGRYIGGIVGSGCRVSDCISMVEITDCTQLGGAIAGEITDDYRGNCFVSDTLAGVDRVSLSGKADQLDYDALCAMERTPEEFRHLTLRFVADGETLQELRFDYGASFTDAVFPQAPEKDGCYVRWEPAQLTQLHMDTTVTAVYEPYVTTLASDQERDGRPVLLAEGQFRDGNVLQAAETGADGLSGRVIEAWSVQLPEDGQITHTVRWRIPADGGKHFAVYTNDGDGWTKVKSEVIGSYLRFDLDRSGSFAVVHARQLAWLIWMLAAVCVVLLAAGLIVRRRWKGRAGESA